MLHADDVLPLLLEASPSFWPIWRDIEDEYVSDTPGQTRLHYLDAAAFARHLLGLHKEGKRAEVRLAFDVIERMEVEGDVTVRALATMGYLEGVQNLIRCDEDISHDEFVGYLGPRSLLAWIEINGDWGTTDR